jgi:hypothetical protein
MDSLLRLRRGPAKRAEPEVASSPQLDSVIVPIRSPGQQSMSRSTGDAMPESEALSPACRGLDAAPCGDRSPWAPYSR